MRVVLQELGGVRLIDLAEDPRIGTPAYVYDVDAIARAGRDACDALGRGNLVAYALKANAAPPIVRALVRAGCGVDVVSGGELALALACGADPDRIVWSGVAKSDDEIDRAVSAGAAGILSVNAESIEEVARINARAASLGKKARIALRINPGLDVEDIDTHAHVATGHDEAKFGIALDDVPRALEEVRRAAHVELVGLSTHAGSQLALVDTYLQSARIVFRIAREIRASYPLTHVDTGGGFGISYEGFEGQYPPIQAFASALLAERRAADLDDLSLVIEPGRSLVAQHGVLLAKVIQKKRASNGSWLLLDAGMNDLVRPALYGARHRILNIAPEDGAASVWRVAGPVCESADDFGEHELHGAPPRFVVLLDAGAYGFAMSSDYNARPRAAEVFVANGKVDAIVRRASIDAWVRARLSGESS